jgi:hypothetical protein
VLNLKKNTFIIIYLFTLLFVLIYLNNLIPLNLRLNSPHDDGMMVNRANNILEGQWLGVYDQFALAKDAGFSIFLSLISLLSISYINAITVILFVTVLFLVIAIQKIFNANFYKMIIVSTPLFFFPTQFIFGYRIIYRDLFIALLIITMIAGFINLINLIHNWDHVRFCEIKLFANIFIFSISYSIIFLVRSKTTSAHILGVATILYLLYSYLTRNHINKIVKITSLSILFLLPSLSIYAVTQINEKSYGVALLNDYSYGTFPKAMKEISRLKPIPTTAFISISRIQREKAYSISPNFNELSEIIENPDNSWRDFSCNSLKICDDFSTGWVYWAIRDAAAQKGYFNSLIENQEFFRQVANEIENYCNSNSSQCSERGVFELPHVEQLYYTNVMPSFTNNVKRILFPENPSYFFTSEDMMYMEYDKFRNHTIWQKVIKTETNSAKLKDKWTNFMKWQRFVDTFSSTIFIWMIIGLINLRSRNLRSEGIAILPKVILVVVLLSEIATMTFIESNVWGVMGGNYLLAGNLILWFLGYVGWIQKINFRN